MSTNPKPESADGAASSRYQMLVSALPQFEAQQSDPENGRFVFSYLVEIINTGLVAAQVVSRYWSVNHADGLVQQVRGLGVVGYQPLLKPGESFEYKSQTMIYTPTGTMHGHYFCVAEDGHRFEVPIPIFILVSKWTSSI